MSTTYDRHLLRRFLHVFVAMFVTTFGLFVVIDGFSNVDGFQEDAESISVVLSTMTVFYAYQSILFFDLTAGILSVVAVVVSFALLVKHGELAPILAAGIPTHRLIVPFALGVLLVEGLTVANQEFLIPRIAHELRARKTGRSVGHEVEPVYDHATHVHLAGRELFLRDRKLAGADITLPVPRIVTELTTLRAEEAHYFDATPERPAGWLLRGALPRYDRIPLAEGQRIVLPGGAPDEVFVASEVGFDQLSDRSGSAKFLSTRELVRRVRHPSSGLETKKGLVLLLHARLVRPAGSLLALFVAVPLVVRRESRSLILNMATCAAVLAGFMAFAHLCHYLGGANLVRPDLAVWLPIVVQGTAGAWLAGIVQT